MILEDLRDCHWRCILINDAKLSTRGLRHQYGISGCKSHMSLLRNAPRGPGAMRGGCIRRLVTRGGAIYSEKRIFLRPAWIWVELTLTGLDKFRHQNFEQNKRLPAE